MNDTLRPVQEQAAPTPNASKPVWELVMADMAARDVVGRERYGTPLQAHNGRDPLVDAYQECLDQAVYLRQAIEERGGARPGAKGETWADEQGRLWTFTSFARAAASKRITETDTMVMNKKTPTRVDCRDIVTAINGGERRASARATFGA